MRTGDPLRLLVLLTAVPLSSAAVHQSFNPSTATCSAPIRAQLDPAPLSSHDQDLLQHLLPQPTSDQPAVRGELRAPFHIPCQLTSFPHLQEFVDEIHQQHLVGFEVRVTYRGNSMSTLAVIFDAATAGEGIRPASSLDLL
ncbi:hypothetical protein, variant 1 [Phytophthora nicotianae INRA-310]|uniref:Uncharacterized protein n=1 Tax=Phytophthora nicotianae (strain INRA-310) TaxID=761204 RepID=W2PGE3_PHYN3|nr:hypothetical protein, variant 1 [Phytophthora nicotianae INRA-310]ETM99941.1 hypothetical protein, variant 1 [Phytophthora nicotianae INRA-310]